MRVQICGGHWTFARHAATADLSAVRAGFVDGGLKIDLYQTTKLGASRLKRSHTLVRKMKSMYIYIYLYSYIYKYIYIYIYTHTYTIGRFFHWLFFLCAFLVVFQFQPVGVGVGASTRSGVLSWERLTPP